MAPTRQGPGRPHLLGRLRRTQRPGGVGADGRGEESCILGGGACRACRAGCAASHPGKKAGAAWNEWDREPLPGYKSCDLEMTWEGQSRHLKLKQKQEQPGLAEVRPCHQMVPLSGSPCPQLPGPSSPVTGFLASSLLLPPASGTGPLAAVGRVEEVRGLGWAWTPGAHLLQILGRISGSWWCLVSLRHKPKGEALTQFLPCLSASPAQPCPLLLPHTGGGA